MFCHSKAPKQPNACPVCTSQIPPDTASKICLKVDTLFGALKKAADSWHKTNYSAEITDWKTGLLRFAWKPG